MKIRFVEELERQKENMTKMQAVGRQIAASHVTLEKLDTEGCLERVEKTEKEGTRFMDIEQTDVTRKKKMGAVIAAAVIGVMYGSSQLMAGAAEVIAYGTAVKIPGKK